MDDYDFDREYFFLRLRQGSTDWAKFTRFEDGSAYVINADFELGFEQCDDAWQLALNWLEAEGFVTRDEAVRRSMIPAIWEPPN